MARRMPLVVFLFTLGLCGCGDRAKPGETVVRGQILYRGQPLSGGTILLTPNLERGCDGPLAIGQLQEDGSFTLVAEDGKPVLPGWYRITIAPRAGTVDVPTADRPYPGLSAKYRNPAKSGLEREIKLGIENLICLDLDDA